MKKFKNMTLNKDIDHAIADAERLFDLKSPMMQELYYKNDWKYGAWTGADVVTKLALCAKVPHILFYRPWNVFTRALGYSDGRNIYINARKIDTFDHRDLVGLLLHERSHIAGFSHGSNYPSTEKNFHSVPYYISHGIGLGKWL